MSTTIDHLRIDHRVTVLRDFVDTSGGSMQTGDTGILRRLSFDQLTELIKLEIETEAGLLALTFDLRAKDGPRNGHMREFFEVGEDVSVPRRESVPSEPVRTKESLETPSIEPDPSQPSTVDSDRLLDMENAMRRKFDHIGVAASIAEVYAERMRDFRRKGNEPRAIAAFKLAKEWMGTYAGWATSGGEGAANSYERDRFCEALVTEFGYDPTASESET